jgi:NAD(P)H-hydrate epimerase
LPRLPRREPDAHKGTFGSIGVVGGSSGDLLDQHGARGPCMIGAPAIAAVSALRAGAGLVRIGAPAPILHHAVAICPGATGLAIPTDADGWIEPHQAAAFLDRLLHLCDVIAIGPGLGTSPGACSAVLRTIQQEALPVVLDADAINCLGQIPDFVRDFRAAAVLTPHPGEFKRLVAALGLKGDMGMTVSREKAAEQMAQRLGRIVVLKGHHTVVTDGLRTWVNPSGHPCMATAGTGDVLTGVLAAIIAQFVAPPLHPFVAKAAPALQATRGRPLDLFDAARVAVYVHGLAGEFWAGGTGCQAGLLAAELADLIPHAVETLRSS